MFNEKINNSEPPSQKEIEALHAEHKKQKNELPMIFSKRKPKDHIVRLNSGGFYVKDFNPPRRSAKKALRNARIRKAYFDYQENKPISSRMYRTLRRCGLAFEQ